jgi:DNA polymerase/3'-5' exonuclease PolX
MKQKAVADRQHFKIIAYTKAIKSIKDYFVGRDIVSIDDVIDIPYIGAKIQSKIAQILDLGYLPAADKIRNDPRVILINEITQIYGIGPAKAKKLVDTDNISSLEELVMRQAILLNSKQQLGLKYYSDISHRIPRREIDNHKLFLREVLRSIDPRANLIVVGSYLRGVKTSGDIDVLLYHPDNDKKLFKKFITTLKQVEYITAELLFGSKKFAGMVKLDGHKYNRRLDVLFTSTEELPFAQLYFTGSGSFNVLMRKIAIEQGYRLNEHSIKYLDSVTKKPTEKVHHHFNTEKDIFEFLGIQYLKPSEREPNNIRLL